MEQSHTSADNGEVFNQKTSEVVKCAQCGADMLFDIQTGKLKCPYCQTTKSVDSIRYDTENSLENFDESKLKYETGAVTYQCPNCHAKTVMHGYETAVNCAFCGATNIVKVEDLPGLKPDAMLPFAVTREQAADNARKWIKKKAFAPSKLKKLFTVENMHGLYTPAFTFDSQTLSQYDGKFGEHYTVTVGSGKNRRTEVRTRWYHVNGYCPLDFDDLLVEASPTFDQKQVNKIGGFDTKNTVTYSAEYIAGFASERHNISVSEAYSTAKQSMAEAIRAKIIAKYNPDVIAYLNINTKYTNSTYRYLLLPIWNCAYKYKQKLFNFLVNGRTGQAGGKAPVSVFKVILTVIAALAAAYLLYKLFSTDSINFNF